MRKLEEEEAVRAKRTTKRKINLMNEKIKEENRLKFRSQSPLQHKFSWGANQSKVRSNDER